MVTFTVPAASAAVDGAQFLLGQREDDRDRLHLGHHDDAGGVRRVHDVSRIDQADSRAAVDRRDDARVVELRARVVDHRLIDLKLRGELIDRGALGVDRLLAREILGLQQRVAREIALRVRELRRIFRFGRDRLLERRLIRSRIDLRQQIPLMHGLAFGERDLLQLPVHARRHRHGVERLHRAEPLQVDRHVRVRDGGGVDRDRRRRLLRRRIRRLVQQAAPGDQQQRRQGERRRSTSRLPILENSFTMRSPLPASRRRAR